MVLPLKRWKSRTPPGIVAGGLCKGYNPFTMPKGQLLTEKALFRVSGFIAKMHRLFPPGKQPTSSPLGIADPDEVYRGVEQPGSSSGS